MKQVKSILLDCLHIAEVTWVTSTSSSSLQCRTCPRWVTDSEKQRALPINWKPPDGNDREQLWLKRFKGEGARNIPTLRYAYCVCVDTKMSCLSELLLILHIYSRKFRKVHNFPFFEGKAVNWDKLPRTGYSHANNYIGNVPLYDRRSSKETLFSNV